MAGNTIDIKLHMRDDGSVEKSTKAMQRANAEKAKLEGREYGVARSAVGTGAAGRDFAKQAEGLGGFVRVYATFAANAFAAQAAFTALSNAMDTTNMVKGMDQLGAASGVALGSLAKQFAATTQGAISFREAAQAVTKATASGLGAQQTLQIAQVATKASQALGVDLNDAVSRLSRGITKLEPELLDELGIFTKIEPAVEAYARRLGKAATQLTDFERRQAFAVAVLEEGNRKFSEIQLDVNPYTKLLASFRDLAQSGLELVNTVLGPLVRLLSESPIGLSAVIGAIGLSLLRQAIPAINGWKASLKDAADTAKARAAEINQSFGERFVARQERIFDIPQLQKQSEDFKRVILNTEKEIAEKRKELGAAYRGSGKNIRALGTAGADIMDPTTGAIQKKVVESAEARIKIIDQQVAAGKAKNIEALNKEKALLQEILRLESQRTALAAKEAALQQNLAQRYERIQNVADVPVTRFGEERQRQIIAARAEARAMRLEAYSAVSQATQEGGLREGFAKLGESVSNTSGIFNKLRITAVGSFIAIGNAISTALAAFAPWITAITLAIPVIGYFYEKIRGNTKEIEATNEAFGQLKDASAAAVRTLEYYSSRGTQLTVAGAAAASNALFTLSDAFENVAVKASKELNATGLYRAVEAFQNFFGFGTQAELARVSIENLANAFKLLESNTRFFTQFKDQVTSILNIPATSSIEDILKAIGKATPEVQKQIAQAQKLVATQFKGATEETKAFNDQLNETAKVADSIITSLLPGTGMGRWADLGLKNVEGLNRELLKGADNLDEIRQIANSTDLAKKFAPETVGVFLANQQKINQLSQQQVALSQEERDIRKELAEAEAQYQERLRKNTNIPGSQTLVLSEEQRQLIRKDFPQIDQLKSRLEGIQLIRSEKIAPEVKKVFDNIQAAQDKSAERFAQTLITAVGAGYAKAALVLEKGRASLLTQELPKALADFDITVKESNLQQQQLTETKNLIKSLEQASIEMANLANVTERKAISDLRRAPPTEITQAEREKLDERARALEVSEAVVRGRQALFKGGMGALSTLTGGTPRGTALAESFIAKDAELTPEQRTEAAAAVRRGIITSSTVQNVTAIGKATADAAALENQKKVAAEIRDARIAGAKAAERVRDIEVQISQLNISKQVAELSVAYGSAADKAKVLAGIEQQVFEATQKTKEENLKTQIATAERLRDIKGLSPEQKEIYSIEVDLLKTQQARASTVTAAERDLLRIKNEESIRLAEIADKYRLINYEVERQKMLLETTRNIEDMRFEAATSRVDILAQTGRLTEQEVQDRKAVLESQRVEREGQRKLQDLRIKEDELRRKLDEESERAGGEMTPGVQTALENLLNQQAATRQLTTEINANTQAKLENIRITNSMSVEQRKFTEFATRSFESMGDALADFAMTGKLNFKSLVDSMISDFIRMMIRMQMQGLLQPGGGQQGIGVLGGNWLAKVFGGFGGSSTPTPAFDAVSMSLLANGGAFDSGIQKFGKGGMFTNSIVHSPTLFKFANGTGLMGEAGPEAIMPLTRDNTGRLGVQAQGTQPQVDVVVNNYSGQQATTRETKDSRGNRKIEVIVGDMTAGEMSRPGSNTQQSLRTNFGIQPTLTRR